MKLQFGHFILVFVFFTNTNIYSQDLRNDTSFFNNKLKEYKEWLEISGYTQVIHIDSLSVSKGYVILYLGSKMESMDTLAAAWCKLKRNFNSKIDYAIYEGLFNRFIFDMEISREAAIININGKNPELFNVKIHFNKELIVTENFNPCQTMGQSEIKVNLNDIKPVFNTAKLKSNESLYTIRKKISSYLQDYYKNHGTFFHNSNIDIITDNFNELTFEVTAIKNLILNDIGYFEYHLIDIKIQKVEDEIVIDINLLAKYGSGLVFVPRKTDYKDMDPKYSNYVEKFQTTLKNNIIGILIN